MMMESSPHSLPVDKVGLETAGRTSTVAEYLQAYVALLAHCTHTLARGLPTNTIAVGEQSKQHDDDNVACVDASNIARLPLHT